MKYSLRVTVGVVDQYVKAQRVFDGRRELTRCSHSCFRIAQFLTDFHANRHLRELLYSNFCCLFFSVFNRFYRQKKQRSKVFF